MKATSQTRLAGWLSNREAGAKLGALLVVSVVLVALRDPGILVGCATVAAGLWLALGRLPQTGVQSRPWLWFGLMLVLLGGYTVWMSGWGAAIATMARLLTLVLLALMVMRTTAVSDMMAFVERLLQPLGRLGWVDPGKVALAFGLTIRFLPVLRQQWDEIAQAQAARGLQANPVALLIPMLARTMQRAEEIAQTLEARSFGE